MQTQINTPIQTDKWGIPVSPLEVPGHLPVDELTLCRQRACMVVSPSARKLREEQALAARVKRVAEEEAFKAKLEAKQASEQKLQEQMKKRLEAAKQKVAEKSKLAEVMKLSAVQSDEEAEEEDWRCSRCHKSFKAQEEASEEGMRWTSCDNEVHNCIVVWCQDCYSPQEKLCHIMFHCVDREPPTANQRKRHAAYMEKTAGALLQEAKKARMEITQLQAPVAPQAQSESEIEQPWHKPEPLDQLMRDTAFVERSCTLFNIDAVGVKRCCTLA